MMSEYMMKIVLCLICFFFKQKTAYEMRISDWSSDVCSSDLIGPGLLGQHVDDDRFAVDACGGRLLIFTQAKIIAARLRQVFRHSDYPFKSRPPRRDPVSNNFSPPCRYLDIKSS